MNIVFLAYRDWAFRVIERVADRYSGSRKFETLLCAEELEQHARARVDNSCIYMALGWSDIIKSDITERFLCLGVHPSDLPMYRGGSPIQNQIIDGITETKCSLFQITSKLDGGDIWLKTSLSLQGDSISDILENVTQSAVILVQEFIDDYPNIVPVNQDTSKGLYRKRRSPEDSNILQEELSLSNIVSLYNKIRCLTDPYPNAFIEDEAGNKLYFEKVRFERAGTPS